MYSSSSILHDILFALLRAERRVIKQYCIVKKINSSEMPEAKKKYNSTFCWEFTWWSWSPPTLESGQRSCARHLETPRSDGRGLVDQQRIKPLGQPRVVQWTGRERTQWSAGRGPVDRYRKSLGQIKPRATSSLIPSKAIKRAWRGYTH